jgi:hypothetical protein
MDENLFGGMKKICPFIMPDNGSPRGSLPCFSVLALGLTPSWWDLKGCHYPIPKALGG